MQHSVQFTSGTFVFPGQAYGWQVITVSDGDKEPQQRSLARVEQRVLELRLQSLWGECRACVRSFPACLPPFAACGSGARKSSGPRLPLQDVGAIRKAIAEAKACTAPRIGLDGFPQRVCPFCPSSNMCALLEYARTLTEDKPPSSRQGDWSRGAAMFAYPRKESLYIDLKPIQPQVFVMLTGDRAQAPDPLQSLSSQHLGHGFGFRC